MARFDVDSPVTAEPTVLDEEPATRRERIENMLAQAAESDLGAPAELVLCALRGESDMFVQSFLTRLEADLREAGYDPRIEL